MNVRIRCRWIWAACVVTLIGGALRFWGLTRLDLWFDENCTYYIEHHFFHWPISGPDRWLEVAHIPYYFLLSLWTSLVGETAWGLRSFSALTGTLTIPLMAIVATRLAGRRVGIVAAILTALHPLHIHYSQEARVYTFWALVSLGVMYALLSAVRFGRRNGWFLFCVFAWLLVLTHSYALLLLPATACAVFAARTRGRALKQWVIACASLGLLLVPAVVWLVIPQAARGPKTWLAEVWQESPGFSAVARSIWTMMPAGSYPHYLGGLGGWERALRFQGGVVLAGIVEVGPAMVVAGLVAVCLFARGRGRSGEAVGAVETNRDSAGDVFHITVALAAIVFCFLFTAMIYSYIAGPAYVVGRYDFVAFPAAVIATAGVIETASRKLCKTRRGRLIAVAVIVGFLAGSSLITTLASRNVDPAQRSQARAEVISAHVDPHDLVISVNQYRWFLTYEWSRRGFAASVVSFPAAHAAQICWRDPVAELADPNKLETDAETTVARVLAALRDGGRAWMVTQGRPETPEFRVDRILYAKLVSRGIEIRPVDDWSGLAELTLVTLEQ